MPQKGDLVQIKIALVVFSKVGLVTKVDEETNHVWVKWPDKSQWENPNFLKVIEL